MMMMTILFRKKNERTENKIYEFKVVSLVNCLDPFHGTGCGAILSLSLFPLSLPTYLSAPHTQTYIDIYVAHIYIKHMYKGYIYIYMYIVIHRQTVSLYHNSSVWLDT